MNLEDIVKLAARLQLRPEATAKRSHELGFVAGYFAGSLQAVKDGKESNENFPDSPLIRDMADQYGLVYFTTKPGQLCVTTTRNESAARRFFGCS